MQKFYEEKAIDFGWTTMKKNIGFFILLLLAVFCIYLFTSLLPNAASQAPLLALILNIAGWVITTIVQMGMLKIALSFSNNEKGKWADLFSTYRMFFYYLGASILYGLIVIFGLMMLVFPGIIWAIRFQFFGYLIVDKNVGPVEALTKSWSITRGAAWNIFMFNLLFIAINMVGALCLLVGLFATIPATMVAYAHVYRQLLAKTETA